jgi:serine/threonine protein kinase
MGNLCSKLCAKNTKTEPLIAKEVNKQHDQINNEHSKQDITLKTTISNLKSSTISNTFINASDYSFMTKDTLKHDFDIIKTLGRGSFGKVLLVKHKVDNKLYAMKILKKEIIKKTNQVAHTKTEREILERMDFPFIVRLQFAFQTHDKLYLITDFMQGGELFYHLRRETRFNESKTKIYTAQIVLAIEYLHKNKIIYRDLKPENVLLDRDGFIKLTDFGLSKFVLNADTHKVFTICGTPEYLAPEILGGIGYDKTVDWWSLGVLVYEMLNGVSPFKFRKEKKLDINNYKRPIDIPKSFSYEAQSFIRDLLQVEPKNRLGFGPKDAEAVKAHEFFSGIDWKIVYVKRCPVPFKPVLMNNEDLNYFDKQFTNEQAKDSPTNDRTIYEEKEIEDEYERFSYVKEDNLLK